MSLPEMPMPAPFDLCRFLPAETRFLLEIVAAGLGGPAAQPDSSIRWPRFLSAVRHHRLVPLMGPALSPDGPVPDAVRSELARLRKAVAMQTLGLGAELARIAAAFERAGVEVLTLKGPAQSVLFYGDPGRRWCRDIDLLVRPEDEAAALAILRGLGYGETAAMVSRDLNAIAVRHAHMPFPVDLHIRLADDDRMFPCALLRPFDNTVGVTVGGVSVSTLATEAAVVFAAYHGTRHLWRRLCWLGDLAVVLHAGKVDWPAALDLARRMGTERHLGLAMVLVENLFGLPLPPVLADDVRLVNRARRAAAALRPVLADGGIDTDQGAFHRFGRLRFVWWDMTLYRRPAACRAVLAVRARPSDHDRDRLRLPPGLGFFYYIVRVVRVLCEAWAAWRRKP